MFTSTLLCLSPQKPSTQHIADTPERLDSPSSTLPITPSVQRGPSGSRRGRTLSKAWQSPPLGLRENLLHSPVKWRGPCALYGERHSLQCLTVETDWQKSGGRSIFLRLLLQMLLLSLIPPPHPSLAWLTCMWMR